MKVFVQLAQAALLSAIFTWGFTSRWRWPEGESSFLAGRPKRRLAALVAFALVMIPTVILPLRSMVHGASARDLASLSFPEMFFGHATLALFLLLWWGLVGFPSPSRFLAMDLKEPVGVVLSGAREGVFAWLAATTAATLASLAFESMREPLQEPAAVPDVVKLIVGLPPGQRLMLVLSAGFFEEAFFRSFLQPRCGLLVSSLIFAGSHASYGLPVLMIGVFAVSVVLGLLFRRTGNVVPCMVAHATFDALQLFVMLPLALRANAGG